MTMLDTILSLPTQVNERRSPLPQADCRVASVFDAGHMLHHDRPQPVAGLIEKGSLHNSQWPSPNTYLTRSNEHLPSQTRFAAAYDKLDPPARLSKRRLPERMYGCIELTLL